MSLVHSWRKVRLAERLWLDKIQLCFMWQGWRSWLLVSVDRAVLSLEISCLVAPTHVRLAVIARIIDVLLEYKTKTVRHDRRRASVYYARGHRPLGCERCCSAALVANNGVVLFSWTPGHAQKPICGRSSVTCRSQRPPVSVHPRATPKQGRGCRGATAP